MSFQGKKNVYTCNACGSKIVTIDRDEGVTPFAMECKADCGGDMLSGFYRALPSDGEPECEWAHSERLAAGASQEGGAGA
jgi:hypothetical protein